MVSVVLLCLYCLASVIENYLSRPDQPNLESPAELPMDPDFWSSFFVSLLSTVWVEMRDKTFILAGVYAASKSRKSVWWAYLTVMLVVTLENCVFGYTYMTLLFTNREAELAYITFAYIYFEEFWYLSHKKPATDDLLVPLNPNNKVVKTLSKWLDVDTYVKACVLLFLVECTDTTIESTSDLAKTKTFGGVFLGSMFAFAFTASMAVLAGWWLGTHLQKRHLLLSTTGVFSSFAIFESVF